MSCCRVWVCALVIYVCSLFLYVYGLSVVKRFSMCVVCLVEYVVFVCVGCGRFLVAKVGQKSKRCNYCGMVVDLFRARRVASAGSAREASRVVRGLKMREGEKE